MAVVMPKLKPHIPVVKKEGSEEKKEEGEVLDLSMSSPPSRRRRVFKPGPSSSIKDLVTPGISAASEQPLDLSKPRPGDEEPARLSTSVAVVSTCHGCVTTAHPGDKTHKCQYNKSTSETANPSSSSLLSHLPFPIMMFPAMAPGFGVNPGVLPGALPFHSAFPFPLMYPTGMPFSPMLPPGAVAANKMPLLVSAASDPPPAHARPRPKLSVAPSIAALESKAITSRNMLPNPPKFARKCESPDVSSTTGNLEDCSSPDNIRFRSRSAQQRREANARERYRVQLLLQAFDNLRDCLPNVEPDRAVMGNGPLPRPSKIWILRSATAYIKALMELLDMDPAQPESVEGFDQASSWLTLLLSQPGRLPPASMQDVDDL